MGDNFMQRGEKEMARFVIKLKENNKRPIKGPTLYYEKEYCKTA
jgi:hypothetical protein